MQFLLILLAVVASLSLAHSHLRNADSHDHSHDHSHVDFCATQDFTKEELVHFDALDNQKYEEGVAKHGIVDLSAGGVLPLEVYWHVIYSSSGEGQLTQQEIDDSMRVLNEAFGFVSGPVFRLLPENIDYIQNDEWFNILPFGSKQNAMKAALRQGGPKTLNIYSTKIKLGVLGYATFPSTYASNPVDDGVVLHYDTVPGGGIPTNNQGLILVHEVGHWMGLYHTFQDGCTGLGDRVNDTPPEAEPTYGCPASVDTCPNQPGFDSLDNHMSYADDFCRNSFTSGQLARIRQQMIAYRL